MTQIIETPLCFGSYSETSFCCVCKNQLDCQDLQISNKAEDHADL